jgi:hypothetical protein
VRIRQLRGSNYWEKGKSIRKGVSLLLLAMALVVSLVVFAACAVPRPRERTS